MIDANGLMMTMARCISGKGCKNPRGLKINQARIKCLDKENQAQRIALVLIKTQEEHGPDSPHRAPTQTLHRVVWSDGPQLPTRVCGSNLMSMLARLFKQQQKVMLTDSYTQCSQQLLSAMHRTDLAMLKQGAARKQPRSNSCAKS